MDYDPREEKIEIVLDVIGYVDFEFCLGAACTTDVLGGEPYAALVLLVHHLHFCDLAKAEDEP